MYTRMPLPPPRSLAAIVGAGVPAPIKSSSCWYCPASKKQAIARLQEHHPDLLQRNLARDRRPGQTHLIGQGCGPLERMGHFVDRFYRVTAIRYVQFGLSIFALSVQDHRRAQASHRMRRSR
jgi:hypothetical protein